MRRLIATLLCISTLLSIPLPAFASDSGWTCSNCGRQNTAGSFCPECGSKKPEAPVCSGCGYQVKTAAARFCPNCGKSLLPEDETAAEENPPALELDASTQAEGEVAFDSIAKILAQRSTYTVSDAESALAIPELSKLVPGLTDPQQELVLVKETHTQDASFYRFDQYYQGLPVYSGQVVVAVSEAGANGRYPAASAPSMVSRWIPLKKIRLLQRSKSGTAAAALWTLLRNVFM